MTKGYTSGNTMAFSTLLKMKLPFSSPVKSVTIDPTGQQRKSYRQDRGVNTSTAGIPSDAASVIAAKPSTKPISPSAISSSKPSGYGEHVKASLEVLRLFRYGQGKVEDIRYALRHLGYVYGYPIKRPIGTLSDLLYQQDSHERRRLAREAIKDIEQWVFFKEEPK